MSRCMVLLLGDRIMTSLTSLRTLPVTGAIVLAALLLGGTCRAGVVGSIIYSWEGTLEPLDDDDDPWEIGAAKPFFISVTLEMGSRDFSEDVDLAIFGSIFDLVDMEFRIDGALAADSESYGVDFTDGTSSDLIRISINDAFFNGAFGTFATEVFLPGSTFTFQESMEFPPAFPVTATKGLGLGLPGCCDSPGYLSWTQPGINVTGTRIGEPADLTNNGFVDFEDLTILLANWNQNVGEEFGNLVLPNDTPVNFEDLTVLLAEWTGPGRVAAPGVALRPDAVPEPSTLLLALVAIVIATIPVRRNRRRSRAGETKVSGTVYSWINGF